MARIYDDPSTPPTAYVVAVLAVLLIGIVYALEGYYGRVAREEAAEKVMARSSEELAGVRAEQQQRISRTEWIDREAGIVAIPLERAMELVAAELEEAGGSVSSR